MKAKLRLLALLVTGILVLSSCGALLDFIIPDRFKVDGTEYDVAKFYILYYGELTDNGKYYLDLWLVSEGVVVNSSGEGAGTGDVIGLYVISSTPTLGEGTFTFVDDFEGEPGTMYGGRAFVGADYGEGTADATYVLNGGTLNVRTSAIGDDYILDFEGTAEGGVNITARYRGPLENQYDMTDTPVGPIPAIR
jgi:hypothetical protein